MLTYLQIMVFYNLFTFMSDQKAVNDVRALVIKLLEDEQLEVKSQVCGNTWLNCVVRPFLKGGSETNKRHGSVII